MKAHRVPDEPQLLPNNVLRLREYLEDHYRKKEKPLFTFLSGSIAEELSTPQSDYDVYAIYEDCEETETVLTNFILPIEITSIRLSKLSSLFSSVSEGTDLANLSPYDLLLCHRVISGIAIDGQPSFDRLRGLLSASVLSQRLSELCSLYAERSLKACSGNIAVGDYRSALLNANHAVRQTFNRLLTAHGATSLLEKWQMVYGKKFLGEQHPAYVEFIRLLSNIPYDDETLSNSYIERAFRYQQAVCDYVHFRKHSLGDFNWASRIHGLQNSSAKMLLRKSAFTRALENNGKYYLFLNSIPLLELPPEATSLWALIDGATSMDELSTKAHSILNIAPKAFYDYLSAFSEINALSLEQFAFKHYKDDHE